MKAGLAALTLLVIALPVTADECAPTHTESQFEHRFGRSPLARTQDELRALIESPTVISSHAIRTDEDGAHLETMTETHAVYPVRARALMATLNDPDALLRFVPNLGDHEIVCLPDARMSRQRQRVDFDVLLFELGTEYVIDVRYVDQGPNAWSSNWVLVDSPDGRMAYIYGSWYFEDVVIDGRTMAYVRHYARTGLTSRVPGLRLFVAGRLSGEITSLFEALYSETARLHGRTASN